MRIRKKLSKSVVHQVLPNGDPGIRSCDFQVAQLGICRSRRIIGLFLPIQIMMVFLDYQDEDLEDLDGLSAATSLHQVRLCLKEKRSTV